MISYENLDALISALKITDEDHKSSLREYVEDLNLDFEVDIKSICPNASLEFSVSMEGYCDLETGEVNLAANGYKPVLYMVIPRDADEFIAFRVQKAFDKLREYYLEEWDVIKEVYKNKAEDKGKTNKKLKDLFPNGYANKLSASYVPNDRVIPAKELTEEQKEEEKRILQKWISYGWNQQIPRSKQNS